MYHLHTLIHMSYVYPQICLTRKGNTTIIEAPFLGSGCGRVVQGAGRKTKRMVVQCINGVSSNPVEGRTKICQLKDLIHGQIVCICQSEIPLSSDGIIYFCQSRGTSESYTYGKQRICFFNSGSAHFHVSWLSDFIFYQKPLYKSLHQSFFYSFITILPSESGFTLHYSTILPQILLFRHLTSIFQTFVT